MKRLPNNEKFEIMWSTEDGCYVVHAVERVKNHEHLGAHGDSPDEAVDMMIGVLEEVEKMKQEEGI